MHLNFPFLTQPNNKQDCLGCGSFQTTFNVNAGSSVSINTRMINGKKVVTKKDVAANGVARVTVKTYENNVLKSHSVNGVAKPI